MEEIRLSLEKLIKHWKDQNIITQGRSFDEISIFESKFNVNLPKDLKTYFNLVNGMGSSYLNDTDKLGFSFFRLEDIKLVEIGFKKEGSNGLMNDSSIFRFADYLQGCWNYAFVISSAPSINDYSVLAYVDSEKFKIISNSISEFINFYIADAEELYKVE